MMRRIIALALLIVSACSLYARQAEQKSSVTKAEAEVRKLERQWLDAYEQRDSEAMERIVADDFTITFPNGAIQTKPQIMRMIKSARSASQPKIRFYTEDVRSRAYGDTVILIGRVVSEYEREGKTVKDQSRYTDTYVRRNGRWQVVASHLSNVEEAKKPAAQ